MDHKYLYTITYICMAGAGIVFIGYMLKLILKSPEPYPSIDPFDEKFDMVLNKIGNSNSLERLDEAELYAIALILKDYEPVHQEKVTLLSQHFRLRRLELEGKIDEANNLADRIEHRLHLKAGYDERLHSHNK